MTDAERARLAEQVRDACIAAAREGYEDAAMAGLCGEGALEVAISAMEKLDGRALVDATGPQQE